MTLLVVGVSHRSAPVSLLERAALAPDTRVALLRDLVGRESVLSAAVLSTCNRIEIYADVDGFHAGLAELSALLSRHSTVRREELAPYLYAHCEDRAVQHLFSVACGLDSMVVGEGQILGQIKGALAVAQDERTAGPLLNELFQRALRVGKRAHSETDIDRAGQSLVTFGLRQLVGETAGTADVLRSWLKGRRALVIGAGSMSALAATTLARAGVAELVIANRTLERAERLATSLDSDTGPRARAVPINAISIAAELALADLVISCTGASGLVLTADAVAHATRLPRGANRLPATGANRLPATGADRLPAPEPGAAAFAETPAAPASEIASAGPTGLVPRAGRVGTAGASVPTDREGLAAGPGQADANRSHASAARQAGPLAILDLAMPRDVDAEVHRLPGVRLVDIESLAEASADAPMAADVDAVRQIVADEVAAFEAERQAAQITPTVVALRSMAADVVASELARLHGRLPGLDDRQRAEITRTVRRVVDKLLHAPTVRVKELAGEPGGADYAAALRELFALDAQRGARELREHTAGVTGAPQEQERS
ncbi:glutamyl-tRNA reductase [Streptomyces sp. B6B3]|uniref:glutamyl-tRNA reductase n=1 Tax=Streptomyces sp. B6B3 TaxID=3153570 RepID=UPI00325DBF1E